MQKKALSVAEDFLMENNLPATDISEPMVELFFGVLNGGVVATIGRESYDQDILLRSLAVKAAFRNMHIASQMINYLLSLCKKGNIKSVYLLTTTAEKYFEKFGFKKIERPDVPGVIRETKEFKNLCPSSAIVMRKILS
ncbi:MAG TPA: arsenic resistance N-acetyltransferase ArsN2 [Puia sp.]|nr:arsenic resistance N-acetyltransferase ArsN2 [Puia sp.]